MHEESHEVECNMDSSSRIVDDGTGPDSRARTRCAPLACTAYQSTPALAAPTATSAPSPTMDIINSAKVTDTRGSDGVSPAIVRAEVMLDRVHASPGVIDLLPACARDLRKC